MSNDLRKKAEAKIGEAREKAGDALATSRAKAGDALKTAKVKAEEATAATRAATAKAAQKTVEGVEHSPLIAVLGGIAIGAIAAALLPKTRHENNMLGKAGDKVRDVATNAANAARDTAKDQLDTLGVTADAAKGQLRDLVDKIGKAANSATSAAADIIRNK